jgi:hypothetical protein
MSTGSYNYAGITPQPATSAGLTGMTGLTGTALQKNQLAASQAAYYETNKGSIADEWILDYLKNVDNVYNQSSNVSTGLTTSLEILPSVFPPTPNTSTPNFIIYIKDTPG